MCIQRQNYIKEVAGHITAITEKFEGKSAKHNSIFRGTKADGYNSVDSAHFLK